MAGEVMIPFDGTPASAGAMPTALRLARAFDAGVRVVRVVEVSDGALTSRGATIGASRAGSELRAEPARELERIADRARAAGVSASGEVLEGDDVADTLLSHARRVGAIAIVMMTTAKGALERATVGSVSDRVMREAGFPVVLVPPTTGDRPAAALAAERPLRHVLVPVDGSAESTAVAERLAALPRGRQIVLTLFRAIDPGSLIGVALPERADGGASLHAHMRAEHDALDAVARGLAANGISARAMTVEATDPSDAIVAAARDEQADLIAMTTRGRGGIGRFAHGSTADAVVRRAPVPVMLMSTATWRGAPGDAA
jgi:nucleotide-binding universal stress UspA family protein